MHKSIEEETKHRHGLSLPETVSGLYAQREREREREREKEREREREGTKASIHSMHAAISLAMTTCVHHTTDPTSARPTQASDLLSVREGSFSFPFPSFFTGVSKKNRKREGVYREENRTECRRSPKALVTTVMCKYTICHHLRVSVCH